MSLSVLTLSWSPLMAQQSENQVIVVQVPIETGAVPLAQPTPAANPVVKTPEEKRLAEILKLKFDRSTASILRTQSTLLTDPPAENPVEQFRRNVIAGRWTEVGAFLKTLPPADADKVYEFLLKELEKVPAPNAGAPQPQQQGGPAPTPTLVVEEIADLADIAPAELTIAQVKLLAGILKRVLSTNHFPEPLIQRLKSGTVHLGGTEPAKRQKAALLLLEAHRNAEAMEFLEPLEPGKETKSFDQLEMHIRASFYLGRQTNKPEAILRGWQLNQRMIEAADCPKDHQDRAFRRYADIVRFLPEDVATKGLKNTFQKTPENGLAVLKQIAVQVSDDRSNRTPDIRKRNLEMQRYAIDALLAVSERRPEWQPAITLFALNWTEEAEYGKQRHVPPREPQFTQFDPFGNPIYFNQGQMQPSGNPNQFPPIPLTDLLPTLPGEAWLQALDPALRARVHALTAELHLKLEDDEKALPAIQKLAALQPKEALNLSNQLLRVWATSHDPQRNSNMRRSGVIYYSGYPMPQGIPLTRALQERNLQELSTLLKQLRSLPIGSLEDSAVVAAFTTAHSQAEVFRTDSIELVFGKLEEMPPATLSELLQTMRHRLATQWRKPNVQQQAKTQRNDAQIDAEVLRGYELLGSLIERGLARTPDDWRLNLAQAATWFDWAEFQYGKKVDLEIYVEKRERSFASFARAAELYAAKLSSMTEKEETPQVYHQWLNANLGASDLALVTRQQEPTAKSLERIRSSILALPPQAAQRHLDALATAISESINTIPAHLKPAYLRSAVTIVQDRPAAAKIREMVAYYDGLLREIELSLRPDGETTIGHGHPFGMFLTVRHTAELERENAGGFSKYLRNQSQMQYYYNPYGTPPVDHRDDLEKQIREKLSERFEIVSITFHDEKVQSRGYGRDGWRETPLAYLLLKAKDPAVDRIPSIRLDVDFIDKQGQVILPVESPVQIVDAREPAPPARPVYDLEVTQTLDDRAIAEGKLMLEVKGTGKGLLSSFEGLFNFKPAGFKIDEVTDSGPAIQRLSSEGDELVALSERNWLIKMSADPTTGSAAQFQFPRPRSPDVKVAYKRYEDADLVEVTPEVAVAGVQLQPSRYWHWVALGTLIVVAGVIVPMRMRRRESNGNDAPAYTAPATATPFSTLEFLRRMQEDRHLGFSDEQRLELAQTITAIERDYFARVGTTPTIDLAAVVKTWLQHQQNTRRAAT